MLRLTSALTAGVYMTLVVFGDGGAPSQISTAQAATGSEAGMVSRSAASNTDLYTAKLSDEDAIKAAVAATKAPLPTETAKAEAEVEAPAKVAAVDTDKVYVTGTVVNMRAGPSTKNPVLSKLNLGSQAELLAEMDNGWAKIRDENGKIGYMSNKFLSDADPRNG